MTVYNEDGMIYVPSVISSQYSAGIQHYLGGLGKFWRVKRWIGHVKTCLLVFPAGRCLWSVLQYVGKIKKLSVSFLNICIKFGHVWSDRQVFLDFKVSLLTSAVVSHRCCLFQWHFTMRFWCGGSQSLALGAILLLARLALPALFSLHCVHVAISLATKVTKQ